ncbi:hypothetical protein GCM10027425_19780 [Alteromonas gracilis]
MGVGRRSPDVRERALLEGLLDHAFDGVEQLRAQATHLLVEAGCECGCGTIDLFPQGGARQRSTSTSPVPVHGLVFDESREPIGGLLLFLSDGLLSSLEVYSYDEPLPLPPLDRVEWVEHGRSADG